MPLPAALRTEQPPTAHAKQQTLSYACCAGVSSTPTTHLLQVSLLVSFASQRRVSPVQASTRVGARTTPSTFRGIQLYHCSITPSAAQPAVAPKSEALTQQRATVPTFEAAPRIDQPRSRYALSHFYPALSRLFQQSSSPALGSRAGALCSGFRPGPRRRCDGASIPHLQFPWLLSVTPSRKNCLWIVPRRS